LLVDGVKRGLILLLANKSLLTVLIRYRQFLLFLDVEKLKLSSVLTHNLSHEVVTFLLLFLGFFLAFIQFILSFLPGFEDDSCFSLFIFFQGQRALAVELFCLSQFLLFLRVDSL